MTALTVGFAGMTHLGIVSAYAATERGANVICFDGDEGSIRKLSSGQLPVNEPGLEKSAEEHRSRICFTSDVGPLGQCDLVIAAPDIPTDDHGGSDLSGLKQLIELLHENIPLDVPLIVLSQIPPGFSRSLQLFDVRPYFYQVETLVFGQALERAVNPERIIVGCVSAFQGLHPSYQCYLELFQCPILQMKFESAELTKIAINCCLVSSVTITNTLAEICENSGAVWSDIENALRMDRRIGEYAYLKPGLGIAGGNLERDLRTIRNLSAQLGTYGKLIDVFLENSRHRKDWVLQQLYTHVFSGLNEPQVAIWGLAYKQDTHSVKNSAALELISHIKHLKISAYDPVVKNAAVPDVRLTEYATALDVIGEADVLVIMTPWAEFKSIDPQESAARWVGNVVIDPYGVIDVAAAEKAGLTLLSMGRAFEGMEKKI